MLIEDTEPFVLFVRVTVAVAGTNTSPGIVLEG